MPLSRGLQANLPYIKQYAMQYGVPLKYAIAQARTEDSSGSATVTTYPGDNIGQYQVSPGVFAQYGPPGGNILTAKDNIQAGLSYLSSLYKRFGSWPLAFAAYNAGPGRIQYDLNLKENQLRMARSPQVGPITYAQIANLLPAGKGYNTPAYVAAITGAGAGGGTGAGTNATPGQGAGTGNGWTSFLVWLHKAENAPRLSAAPWTWGNDAVGIMEWAGVKIALLVLGLSLVLIGTVYLMQSVPSIGGSGGSGDGGGTAAVSVPAPVAAVLP